MNESEVRMILAQSAAVDTRKITDAAIVMWHGLFREYSYGEVKWALMHHFATSTEYLMPAHLIAIVNTKRAEYRQMNPGLSLASDAWLEFEQLQELAASLCRANREAGFRYAVDAMEDTKELES